MLTHDIGLERIDLSVSVRVKGAWLLYLRFRLVTMLLNLTARIAGSSLAPSVEIDR